MMANPDRLTHQKRRDRRSSRSGLVASINRQDHPVINYAVGGLLLGECWLPIMTGQRVFVTLFERTRPKERVFVYGIVVRLDRLTHEVALDFEEPGTETFSFLERLQSRSVGAARRPPPPPRGMLGWLRRLTGRRHPVRRVR